MRPFQSIFNCTNRNGYLSWWCEGKDKDHPIKFAHWRKYKLLSGAPSFLAEPSCLWWMTEGWFLEGEQLIMGWPSSLCQYWQLLTKFQEEPEILGFKSESNCLSVLEFIIMLLCSIEPLHIFCVLLWVFYGFGYLWWCKLNFSLCSGGVCWSQAPWPASVSQAGKQAFL